MSVPAVSIDVLFDSTGRVRTSETGCDVRRILDEAQVVMGRDVMTGNECILYGREIVKSIARGDDPPGGDFALCIALDLDEASDDLERICTLLVQVKGGHEYIGFSEK